MPIDFHDPANRLTYAGRVADESWSDAMRAIVDPTGRDVVDVGCGAGTYSHAWLALGARSVLGVDFSEQMLAAARDAAGAADRPDLAFRRGEATATGLPDGIAEIVFQRALVHHVADLGAAMAEAWRILAPGGTLVVQDRTMEDVGQPAGGRHLRGLIFAAAPRLLEVEAARRPDRDVLLGHLRAAGFAEVEARTLWERRDRRQTGAEFLADVRARRGRSILHELDDDELDALVARLAEHVASDTPVGEADRWTLWVGRRPPR